MTNRKREHAKLREADADIVTKRKREHAKLREAEADFTPRSVVDAILEWYLAEVLSVFEWRPMSEGCEGCNGDGSLHTCGSEPMYALASRGRLISRPSSVLTILDVCAGAGVWASAIRRLLAKRGVPMRIVAVEKRAEEAEHLRRHADEVVIGDWRKYVEQCERDGQLFSWVIGNPAFSQARAQKTENGLDVEASMPAVLTRIAGAVLLYMSQQAWTKTASGYEVRRKHPPAYAVDVPGAVNHRSGRNPENGKRYSSDSIPYSASLWLGRPAGPHVGLTATGMLDPVAGRSWREDLRPGAEPDEWLAANKIPTVEGTVRYLESQP